MEDLISLVEKYSEQHLLLEGPLLVVGVSGGADSMALLFVLQDICKRKYPDMQILCAHVHHGIRAEADEDEKVVQAFCEKLQILFCGKHLNIPEMAERQGVSLETAGRLARYAFFNSLAGEDGLVAVAHHMEDQAESIAMHIFRGCGMEGLCGIRPRSGNVIHPFLCLHKEQILQFCEENAIPYCHDVTNDDSSYDRNFWRNELFPLIEKHLSRNPVSALNGLSERITEENEYLDALAEEALDAALAEANGGRENAALAEANCGRGNAAVSGNAGGEGDGEDLAVPLDSLASMPRALKRRVLRHLALRTFGDVIDIEATHWEAILELTEKTEGSAYIDLPKGRKAAREMGKIRYISGDSAFPEEKGGYIEGVGVAVPEKDKDGEMRLCDLPLGEKINFSQSFVQMRLRSIEKEAEVVYNNLTWFFSKSALEGAVVRTRRTGDTIVRAGNDCRKELRRFMNEVRIPGRFRDRLLLVAKGNETLWLPTFAHAVGFTDAESEAKCRAEVSGEIEETGGKPADDRSAVLFEKEKWYALEFFDEADDAGGRGKTPGEADGNN